MGLIKTLFVGFTLLIITLYTMSALSTGISRAVDSSIGRITHHIEVAPAGNNLKVEYNSSLYGNNFSNGLNLRGGVYNLTELNGSVRNDILDPTKWYVGNSSLNYNYAVSVYNDTLKVVENATKTSESVLDRFFGIFEKLSGGESSSMDSLKSRLANISKEMKDTIKRLGLNKP